LGAVAVRALHLQSIAEFKILLLLGICGVVALLLQRSKVPTNLRRLCLRFPKDLLVFLGAGVHLLYCVFMVGATLACTILFLTTVFF
jgi:hypothetical protein